MEGLGTPCLTSQWEENLNNVLFRKNWFGFIFFFLKQTGATERPDTGHFVLSPAGPFQQLLHIGPVQTIAFRELKSSGKLRENLYRWL